MIKVLVVDDHEIMRQGISLVFELEDDFELVGEACDGGEALEKTEETAPDIILMDIRMPKKDGIQTSKEIKEKWPKIKIMALTAVDKVEEILTAIDSGIDGYMLKNVSASELLDGVRQVSDGRLYLHPSIARQVLEEQKGADVRKKARERRLHDVLTPRESAVLSLMGEGYKNKEIAVKLFLSEETVKSHVSHILAKLEQADRMQAVLFALRHNLIKLVYGDKAEKP